MAEEAVEITWGLAEADRVYLLNLARSRQYLKQRLADVGRGRDAEQVWNHAMIRLGAEAQASYLCRPSRTARAETRGLGGPYLAVPAARPGCCGS